MLDQRHYNVLKRKQKKSARKEVDKDDMDIINICMSNHCSHDSKRCKQKHVDKILPPRQQVEELELPKTFSELKLETSMVKLKN